MIVTPHDIGLLLLFASFVGIMVIVGRVWCVATIIASAFATLVLPIVWVGKSPEGAGVFVMSVGLLALFLRRRLLWRLTPSSLGSRLWALPLSIAAGGSVFRQMLEQLPAEGIERFSFGARALFLLPSASLFWKLAPLVLLLLLQSRRSRIEG